MSSHNATPDFVYHQTATERVDVAIDAENVHRPHKKSLSQAVDKDLDQGYDPYDTAGLHIVPKTKISHGG
jgi:molybdate-binding protein